MYLGDIAEDQVLDFYFGTVATLLGGSVAVYKDNSITEIVTGLTLTADFDGRTGLNHVRIDTSLDAAFTPGSEYSLILIAGTANGQDLFPDTLARFSIQNRYQDKAGFALSTAERNAIANALLDLAGGVETGMTLRQSQRIQLAALAGKLSGAATTTVAVRDTNDTKNRISATVDANGNRTVVTLDAT